MQDYHWGPSGSLPLVAPPRKWLMPGLFAEDFFCAIRVAYLEHDAGLAGGGVHEGIEVLNVDAGLGQR